MDGFEIGIVFFVAVTSFVVGSWIGYMCGQSDGHEEGLIEGDRQGYNRGRDDIRKTACLHGVGRYREGDGLFEFKTKLQIAREFLSQIESGDVE